ncbi:MAG: UDP-3-O-acyl-N-acetylglucosamine deacetylase [Nitrospinaceae bacterium]
MNKERILIVDDEKNIVSSLKGILSDEGYRVSVAEDGLDALEMIQADPPDLVLLDIWLPGMDGIEVLKTVKTYHPGIEVLIMSGHGTIDTAVKATKLGAYDFIEKPFSLDHLTQSVEGVFRSQKIKAGPTLSKYELPPCFQAMVEVKKGIKNFSRKNKPVLFLGEKGTGKELIAQAIHRQSRKSGLPFVKLNCSVRKMQDIQSQLFAPGKRGAKKTGARTPKQIDKVIFLSNIESLSKGLQEKLVQALDPAPSRKNESGPEFLPQRLFVASSKDIKALAEKGMFNEELLDIFNESIFEVPPLREYAANIPVLIRDYLENHARKNESAIPQVDDECMEALCRYDWPENLKELRSVIDKILITSPSRETLTLQDLPGDIRKPAFQVEEPRRRAARTSEKTGKHSRTQPLHQRTLKRSVVLCGSGLHSGIKTGLILKPLPPGSGIIFGDISSGQTISAKLENVMSTDYSTCLKKGLVSVATIEHIMAVLHMYRISNLLIKVGDEAPVMDGSAKDFCELIEDGEFEDQHEPHDEIVIDKTYTFGSKEKGGVHITVEPADRFTVTYHMEYPEPIGIQDYTYTFEGEESFKKEIAPARTFGFMEDVAQLTKMGFASGGKLDNFILLGDNKVLNTKLRYKDEFVRHKILDILGDFYLLGKPIRGKITACKSGHTENIGVLKQIQENFPQAH